MINLFPTTIYHKNDLEFTNKVLEFSNQQLNTLPKYENWGYDTTYATDELNFKIWQQGWIREKTNNVVKDYLEITQQYIVTETRTHFFLSNIKDNGQHGMHNHPETILSGIFYLDISPNSSPITFYHPLTNKNFNTLLPITSNGYNKSIHDIYPKSGDILLWESWLYHSVPPNNSDNRKTLVFNITSKEIPHEQQIFRE